MTSIWISAWWWMWQPIADGGQSVSATTYVKTHNTLGRFYLTVVKPFHRIIVPVMLAQVGKALTLGT
jgi:hypothetical protein